MIKYLFTLLLLISSVIPVMAAEYRIADWEKLTPADAYDFIPEDGISASMWVEPDFQEKIRAAERRTRPELAGAAALLPGYMVPLVYEGELVFEFLLVPSAGQCIHVPPPPPNQTVHVKLEKPIKMRGIYEPLIVEGRLAIDSKQTVWAETAYELHAERVIDFTFELMEDLAQNYDAP